MRTVDKPGIYVCTGKPGEPAQWSEVKTTSSEFAMSISGKQVSVAPGTVSFGTYVCPNGVGVGAVTFSGGSGDAYIYIDRQCQLTTLTTPAIQATASGTMNVQAADTLAFSTGSKPIGHLTITNGTPAVKADLRTDFSTVPVLAGANIAITENTGTLLIETNPGTVPGLGTANNWTGSNDFSAAGSLIVPGGNGPPPAGSCIGATVGNRYVDRAIGGLDYYCKRTGDASYAWTSGGGVSAVSAWFPAATVRADGGADIGTGWWSLPLAGNGAAQGSYTGGTHARAYLAFEPGVSTTAQLNYLLPGNWTPPLGMRIAWQSADLSAAGSLFDLRVSTQCWKAGTRFTASLAWGPEQSNGNGITGLNVDTEEDWQIAKVDSLTMGKCAAGDMLSIQFRRDPAGSLTKAARIYGIELRVKFGDSP